MVVLVNSGGQDETPRFDASQLGLHCISFFFEYTQSVLQMRTVNFKLAAPLINYRLRRLTSPALLLSDLAFLPSASCLASSAKSPKIQK